nr:protein pX [Neckar River virus]
MTSQVGPYPRFGRLGNGDMESTFACCQSSGNTELAMWVYA